MPTGTLLIIDDEARLRQLLAQVLEGYTMLQAPDAHCGLELLQQHDDDVLLVISDVKLPDANATSGRNEMRRTQRSSRTCQAAGRRLERL